jgi:hypothetical protein
MPAPGSSRDDKYFGGKGSAKQAWDSMRRNYGARDAEHVYWGSIAKRKRRATSTRGKSARKWLGL